jgi:hypothetical protein
MFLVLCGVPAGAQWVIYPAPCVPRNADGKVNLTSPLRKAADGKPDLSGVWITKADYFKDLATNLKPGDVDMLPAAKAIQLERETNDHKGDAMAACMPPGVQRMDR